MNKNRAGMVWAALIVAVALAAGIGALDEQIASISYLVIVLAAVIHIRRAPCAIPRKP